MNKKSYGLIILLVGVPSSSIQKGRMRSFTFMIYVQTIFIKKKINEDLKRQGHILSRFEK